jgi:hypothetical protein
MKWKSILFLALSVICWNAFATNNWYVAISGNDTNDGHSSPLRNISTAMHRIQAGDILYIGNGTYRETMQVVTNCTGTSNANITIMPYDSSGVVVIKASDIITNWECTDSAKNIWRSPGFTYNVQQVFIHTNQTSATLDVYNPNNTNSMLEPGICLNKLGMPNNQTYTNMTNAGVVYSSYYWYRNLSGYSVYPESILGLGAGTITNSSFKIVNDTVAFEGYNYAVSYSDATNYMASNKNTFYYSTDNYLYICLGSGLQPTNCAVEVSVRSMPITGYNVKCDHYINYIGLHFRHGNAISGARQSGPGGFTKSSFNYCDFQWLDGTGLTINNSTATNCIFSNNGMLGFNASGSSVISDSLIASNNYRKITDQFIAAGIKVNGNLDSNLHNPTTVEFCNVVGNYGVGVWFDTQRGVSESSVIRNCYIHDNTGPGIEMELSHNIFAYNNLLVTNGGGSGVRLVGSDNCRVWNNTFAYNCAFTNNHTGVVKLACDTRTNTFNNSILNNIFYMSGAIGANAHCFDILVETNISCNNYFQVFDNTIDYNCYYRTITTQFPFSLSKLYATTNSDPHREEIVYQNLPNWQNYFAQDVHSLVIDPGFIFPNSTNFNLGYLSPLIDVGYDISIEDVNDYYGFSRLNWNGCDIGAIECGYDGNGDSLDDDWQALYGVIVADSDNDGDGLTAYAEWCRGCNPGIADTTALTIYVNKITGSQKYTGLSSITDLKHNGPKQFVSQALGISRKSGYLNQDQISVYSYTNSETINLLTNNVLMFISVGSMDLR